MAAPEGIEGFSQLVVSGDRLTVAGAIQPDDESGPWSVTVASTTDLQNWTTANFTLQRPEGLPEGEQSWATPIAVAADDEHWVVRIVTDPVSGPSGPGPRFDLWSGAWGDEPAMSDAGPQFWTLLATDKGFLDLGERVTFSPDGQTWTDVPNRARNVLVQTAGPLGDDVLAVTATSYGESSFAVFDATGNLVTEVEIPELGDGFSASSSMSSPAVIVETWMPTPEQIVIEHDGFELTQEYGDAIAYQLVDLSTGDVVVEESVDLQTTEVTEDGPFEFLVEDMNGITITDPETGATIVEIPTSVINSAWGDAMEGVHTAQPDFWLVATADGETWLLHDLDEASSSGLALVATNGTTVLVGTPGGEPGTDVWQRFSMTE